MNTDRGSRVGMSGLDTDNARTCYVIPCFQNQAGLERTLRSIAADGRCVDEVFIYDDGSCPPIEVSHLRGGDLCLRLIRGTENKGPARAINALLGHAHDSGYSFAALVDAGDVHLPGRIKKQVAWMTENPLVVISGGGMLVRDGHNAVYEFMPPVSGSEILRNLRRGHPFAHPTAMFNVRRWLELGVRYDESLRASIDYDLLYRLFTLSPLSVSNQRALYVEYIREEGSIGVRRARYQAIQAWKIRFRNASLTSTDCLIGLIDPVLVLRILSPKLARSVTAIYLRAKNCVCSRGDAQKSSQQ